MSTFSVSNESESKVVAFFLESSMYVWGPLDIKCCHTSLYQMIPGECLFQSEKTVYEVPQLATGDDRSRPVKDLYVLPIMHSEHLCSFTQLSL